MTKEIVAGVVVSGDEVCLIRRSGMVGSDRGMWHCVTGYLDAGLSPKDQLLLELEEELNFHHAPALRSSSTIALNSSDEVWTVHAYLVETTQREFVLNWENDSFRWVNRWQLIQPLVPWMRAVCRALGYDVSLASGPE